MKKIMLLVMSLIAVFSLGLSVNTMSVGASESKELLITPASDQIFVKRNVVVTKQSMGQNSMWVTETRNGKTYSGYIYKRGFSDASGNYYLFNGYIRTGPHGSSADKLKE